MYINDCPPGSFRGDTTEVQKLRIEPKAAMEIKICSVRRCDPSSPGCSLPQNLNALVSLCFALEKPCNHFRFFLSNDMVSWVSVNIPVSTSFRFNPVILKAGQHLLRLRHHKNVAHLNLLGHRQTSQSQ